MGSVQTKTGKMKPTLTTAAFWNAPSCSDQREVHPCTLHTPESTEGTDFPGYLRPVLHLILSFSLWWWVRLTQPALAMPVVHCLRQRAMHNAFLLRPTGWGRQALPSDSVGWACLRRPYRISRIRVLFSVSGTSWAFQVHGFLSIPAIFRALYDLSIAYNIILYNTLDVFQESLFIFDNLFIGSLLTI